MTSCIIEGKRFALDKRNLLCEWIEQDPGQGMIDFNAHIKSLYYFRKSGTYILKDCYSLGMKSMHIISEKKAGQLLAEHGDGVIEKNYIKFFGMIEEG